VRESAQAAGPGLGKIGIFDPIRNFWLKFP
jgi:hypothetical protein